LGEKQNVPKKPNFGPFLGNKKVVYLINVLKIRQKGIKTYYIGS
jgi:hypothetical protein